MTTELANKLRKLADEIDGIERFTEICNTFKNEGFTQVSASSTHSGYVCQITFVSNTKMFGTQLSDRLKQDGFYIAGWYHTYCIIGKI